MARMTSIRLDLKPYIMHLMNEAVEKGYPVQRPIFIHYETDQLSYDLQYEYLFGSDILIKPVVQQGQTKQEVYLPEDLWVHLWTGTEYLNGGLVIVDAQIGYPPVFYRKNSSFNHLFSEITTKYR
jgi:alpha-glucosidase